MIKYGHYWLMFLCIIIEDIISGCVSLWLYVIVYIELVDIRSRKAIPFLGLGKARSKLKRDYLLGRSLDKLSFSHYFAKGDR